VTSTIATTSKLATSYLFAVENLAQSVELNLKKF